MPLYIQVTMISQQKYNFKSAYMVYSVKLFLTLYMYM